MINPKLSIPGFRDFYPENCFFRNYIFNMWRKTAKLFGFEEYDTPTLEYTEVFTKKSGKEIISQLFNFKDKGGRNVTLKPEVTPSLVKLVLKKYNSLSKPIKWFCISENFRYEKPQKGRLRSFYQLNCDILGDNNIYFDAEIIYMFILNLINLGLDEKIFFVKLSDRCIWNYILQAWNISENNIQNVLSIVDKIDKCEKTKIIYELNKFFLEVNDSNNFYLFIIQIRNIRSITELESFFLKQKFNNILKEKIFNRLKELHQVLSFLKCFNVLNYIKIDFSIVRGLDYYTGVVFEAFIIKQNNIKFNRAIGGGGRFNNLSSIFNTQKLPSVGFAIGDVVLLELLANNNLLPNYNLKIDIAIVSDNYYPETLIDLHIIKKLGYSSMLFFNNNTIKTQIKHANNKKPNYILIYENMNKGNKSIIRVYNLLTKEHKTINRSNLKKIFEKNF